MNKKLVNKFTYLACGIRSSPDPPVGDGSLSTSTLGSALIAASRIDGRRGEAGGEGDGAGEAFTVAITVSVCDTGCKLAADTTWSVATAAAVS